jgi:hypothetical protein
MTKFLQRLLTATLVLAAGCISLPTKSASSAGKTGSIRGSSKTEKIPPVVLAGEVSRFSDELTALVAQAADSFAAQAGTPQARATALAWKTGAATAAMINATGSNPTANLLDMVVWATLERMAFEEYWLPRYGKPVEPILAVTRELEEEVWSMAARVLTPAQAQDLRELIQEWREKHPEQIYISVRFRDFSEIAAVEDVGPNARSGSLFSLLFLDPFAGLDPTTKQLIQTRYFAERALYVMERMPRLLRWQSELVIAQTLATTEVQQLVSNTTTFAQSAQQLTQTVQKFPEQMSAQAPQWQALAAQFQQTFQSGNQMASSVDAAVKSLDSFIQRVAPPPSASVTSPVANASDTGADVPARHPFNVTEYGVAAAQVATAAQQLDTLTHSLQQTTPEIGKVVEQTGLRGRELVDYTYRKAVRFLALVLVGFVVAMLAYRWIASRLFPKSKGNPQ